MRCFKMTHFVRRKKKENGKLLGGIKKVMSLVCANLVLADGPE